MFSYVALRREEYYAKRGLGCYMFALDDGRVIDATTRGNVARYINHSCGGGSGNVQTNPLTGKMEARGKGVRALDSQHVTHVNRVLASISLTITDFLLCRVLCLTCNVC